MQYDNPHAKAITGAQTFNQHRENWLNPGQLIKRWAGGGSGLPGSHSTGGRGSREGR